MRGILRSAGTSIIGSSLTGLIFLLNVNLAVWKVIISVKDLGLLNLSFFFSVLNTSHRHGHGIQCARRLSGWMLLSQE